MAMTSMFDSLGTQPAILINEALSNSIVSYAADAAGLSDRYFENAYADSDLMHAAKQGIFVSAVSLGGRLLRTYVPQLQVFGSGTTLQTPLDA